jgi:hypothetical protein
MELKCILNLTKQATTCMSTNITPSVSSIDEIKIVIEREMNAKTIASGIRYKEPLVVCEVGVTNSLRSTQGANIKTSLWWSHVLGMLPYPW